MIRIFLNKKGEFANLMTKSISEILGKNSEPEFATDGGTSDARFIKNYCEVAELGIRNHSCIKLMSLFIYLILKI